MSKECSPKETADSGKVRRLRWGVLGAARIASACMIPALSKSKNGEIYGLGCRSEERGQSLAREYGIPRNCCRYEEILADPDIEAVYIALPNHLHREWTLRALEAGKNVLCEKPLAVNAGEAQEMVRKARSKGLYLMEAFMYRFHPRSRKIKALVQEGAIGEPRLVRAAFCFRHPDPADIRFRPEMGGGALLDVGCYGVSLSRWVLDAEPLSVQAVSEIGPTGVDLTTVGILRFPGGRIGLVEASFCSALQQTFSIMGTEGAIELPHDAFIPLEKDARFWLRRFDAEEGQKEVIPGTDEYRLMVEHFAGAVLEEKPLDSRPEESVKNMRVLDALAQAARERRTVSLSSSGCKE